MPPVVVALIVGAIALVVGLTLNVGIAGLGILVLIVVVAWLRARNIRAVIGDESTSATTFEASETSIDLGEELLDLLTSARQRSARMLEDHGRLDPFVMYEDREGSVRIRSVELPDPAQVLARARETARSVARRRRVLSSPSRTVRGFAAKTSRSSGTRLRSGGSVIEHWSSSNRSGTDV